MCRTYLLLQMSFYFRGAVKNIFFTRGKASLLFISSAIISWEEKGSCTSLPTEAPKRSSSELRKSWGLSEARHHRIIPQTDKLPRSRCNPIGAVGTDGAPNYYLCGSRTAVQPRHNGEIPGRRGASDGILMGNDRKRGREGDRRLSSLVSRALSCVTIRRAARDDISR